MIRQIPAGLIAVLLAVFAAVLAADLWRHRAQIGDEPGDPRLIAAAAPVILFIAAMGVSDFVMDTLFFEKCRLVDGKRLPGSLVVSPALPLGVTAAAYLLHARTDVRIVLVCMACQAAGAALGVRLVAGFDGTRVRRTVGAAMLLSTVFLLVRLAGAGGGSLSSLPPRRLAVVGVCAFLLGVGNMMGMGAKAPYMAILLMLGLSPDCVLPVVMSACTAATFSGGVQYIRRGLYQRKLALLYSTVGFLGVAAGFLFVMNLPPLALQLIMLVITAYTGVSMLAKRPAERETD